jgi:CRP-like cAMP-binding protein
MSVANDLYGRRRDQMFPKLEAGHIARLAACAERLATRAGTVLVEAGERAEKLFVVLEGSLEVALPGMDGQARVALLEPGDFSGEINTLRGVRGLTRISVHRTTLGDEALQERVRRSTAARRRRPSRTSLLRDENIGSSARRDLRETEPPV